MTLSTYAELQTSIADFLNRDDLTSSIPAFIKLAEAQMQRELRHWQMETRTTTPTTGQFTDLPTDFRSMKRVFLSGENGALKALSPQEMQRKRLTEATATSCYYAITAGQIELYPTPASGTLDMLYIANIPALTDSNTSNWLLTEAPDAYLYGSLMQTAPYLHNDERLTVWSSLFAGAISALNIASEYAQYGDGGLVAEVSHG